MSVAYWYYCNLINNVETLDVVPVVQKRRRRVVQEDANTLRPTALMALRAVVDDELAIGRSTYVFTASVAATLAEIKRADTEHIETETVKVEAVVHATSPVEKTVAHPVTVKAEVQESLSEAATGGETVYDAVEVVAVVDEGVVDVIAASEDQPASIDDVAHESCAVALEEMDSEAAASDVLAPASSGKVLDTTNDVMLDAIAEKPKNCKENFVGVAKGSAEAAHVVEHFKTASAEKAMDIAKGAEASVIMKVVAAIPASGTPAMEKVEGSAATKVNEAPESEIDETMIIDPDVVAKEAAATEAQTSSFSFIPEHIRNNSYAVSSVALAVATAITAAVLARR